MICDVGMSDNVHDGVDLIFYFDGRNRVAMPCLLSGVVEGDRGHLVHVVEALDRVPLALVPHLDHAVVRAGHDHGLAAPRGVHRVDVGGVALEALDSAWGR